MISTTILERMVIEHNMMSVARIYSIVSFNQLGALLNISPNAAEQIAAKMIREERMIGRIDQIDQVVILEDSDASRFDAYAADVCQSLGLAASAIASKYPQLLAH